MVVIRGVFVLLMVIPYLSLPQEIRNMVSQNLLKDSNLL